MSDLDKVAAWQRLSEAAHEYASKSDNPTSRQKLSDAAKAWAIASGGARKPASQPSTGERSGAVWPFASSKNVAKGTPIEEVGTKDLRWLASVVSENIQDESKAQWRERNVSLLHDVEAELRTR